MARQAPASLHRINTALATFLMFGFSFIDLIALLYLVLGIRTIVAAWRERRSLLDDVITPRDRYLLSQLAFYVLVPPGVLLHEFGHVLATWQVGGTVVQFHYALFYGYVVPVGNFTPLQLWWIALSGNLVSIAYGLLAIPLIPRVSKKWQKYLLLAFARVQLTWALIGYPLFTLIGFGDWTTIYNLQTWYVGIPFAVFHLSLIAVLFFINRGARLRLWEISLLPHANADLAAAPNTLNQALPNAAARIQRGNALVDSNLPDLGRAEFQAVLRDNPKDAVALHNIALIEFNARDIPAARRHFQESLAATINNPGLSAANHYRLGLILAEQGKFADAVDAYARAIGFQPENGKYYYWRGMAWRALRDKNRASNDFLKSADLLQATEPQLAQAAREMAFEKN